MGLALGCVDLVCAGAVVLSLSSCSLGPASGRKRGGGEKSVLAGELLAIFPGFLVHGMGHRYAGNTDKANEILTMEAFGLLTAGAGGGLFAIGESRDADAVKIAGEVGMGVGAVAFLGTWIYDIVYTPGEIERYNRESAGRP